jgi:hypothetical protein
MKALNGLFLRRSSLTFSPATERSLTRDLGSPLWRHLRGPRLPASAPQLCGSALGAVGFEFSVSSPVAIHMTLTALPITSAGHFSPRGPSGISPPFMNEAATSV